MADTSSGLRKAVTLRYAVALYMSSVLGSGVLVLPGLAAQIAGPASILAWILLSIASYPMAYTFASLSARRPESGGVYSFAKESFGQRVATSTGWLFVVWYVTGAPAVTVIAASYLAFAFPLGRTVAYAVAGLILLGAFAINYRGIVVSGKVQLAVIVSIVVLLLTTVVTSSHLVRLENFQPFSPNGWLPVGVAGALIFWSYLGYENVSNVAEEFKNPKRDFQRSIVLSVNPHQRTIPLSSICDHRDEGVRSRRKRGPIRSDTVQRSGNLWSCRDRDTGSLHNIRDGERVYNWHVAGDLQGGD